MLHAACAAVFLLTSLAYAAAPPDIACLSDRTVDEVFADERTQSEMASFIIIVGQGIQGIHRDMPLFTQEDWERSIWNDPEFAEFLREKKIEVVYMTGDDHPAFYTALDVWSFPAVLYYFGKDQRSSRWGFTSDRESYYTWIEQITSGGTPVERAYKRVSEEPDNAEARLVLYAELSRENRGTEAYEQLCWLIEHHDAHREALIEDNPDMDEHAFRRALFWYISTLRDNAGVFPERLDDGNGWEDAAERLRWSTAFGPTRTREPEKKLAMLFNLREAIEKRVNAGTASDRDEFILTALTGDPDAIEVLRLLYFE